DDALLYYQLGWTAERHLPPGIRRAEYKNYVPPQMDILWAILRSETFEVGRHRFEHVCHEDDGSKILERFPDDFLERLAALNDAAIERAAIAWVDTGEVRGTVDDHKQPLQDLRELSANALGSGKGLYLYLEL